jgi:hypothetical protein
VISKKKKFDCSDQKREMVNKIFRDISYPKQKDQEANPHSAQPTDNANLGKRALNDLQPLSNP